MPETTAPERSSTSHPTRPSKPRRERKRSKAAVPSRDAGSTHPVARSIPPQGRGAEAARGGRVFFTLASVLLAGTALWAFNTERQTAPEATPAMAPQPVEPLAQAPAKTPDRTSPAPLPSLAAAATNATRAGHAVGDDAPNAAQAGDTPPSTGLAAPKPAAPEGGFSRALANEALTAAAVGARRCRRVGDPNGLARVEVTFAPSGQVTRTRIKGQRFSGTSTAKCINTRMQKVEVPAFEGDSVTIVTTVNVL